MCCTKELQTSAALSLIIDFGTMLQAARRSLKVVVLLSLRGVGTTVHAINFGGEVEWRVFFNK